MDMRRKTFSPSALAQESADKRIDILRLIGLTGSISEAARQAGISYKAAWQGIHTLTNLAGVDLVDKAVGGAGGGGARLTPAGVLLLEAHQQMEVAKQAVLARFSGGAAQAVAGAGLRTSMRNNLPAVVLRWDAVDSVDPMVRVVLQLPDGAHIASSITRESAELLALQPALSVLALCKATAVNVATAAAAGQSSAAQQGLRSANQLEATVTKVIRGNLRDEVLMTLSSGLQLVGFADRPNRLRVGSRVVACLEENAVVLARV